MRDPVPSPISAPTSVPIITLLDSSSLTLVLRTKDSVLTNPRSKPSGVIGMQLYGVVGPTSVPSSIDELKHLGMFSRMPATVTFPGGSGGKLCYVAAYWVTAKGLAGPVSDIVNFTIPA